MKHRALKANLRTAVGFLVLGSVGLAQVPPDFLKLGQEKFERGDYMGAVNALDKAVAKSPQQAEGYFWRGQTKEKQRDMVGALDRKSVV